MSKATKRKQNAARATLAKTRSAKPAKPKPDVARKAAPHERKRSKLATLLELLRRKDGATLNEMMKATGWQAHSVRGALSGTVKRKLGLKVISAKVDGVRHYSIKA